MEGKYNISWQYTSRRNSDEFHWEREWSVGVDWSCCGRQVFTGSYWSCGVWGVCLFVIVCLSATDLSYSLFVCKFLTLFLLILLLLTRNTINYSSGYCTIIHQCSHMHSYLSIWMRLFVAAVINKPWVILSFYYKYSTFYHSGSINEAHS